MITDDSLIKIHILGGSKGESIVVQLPNNLWGVVDCYARSLDDPLSNPTIRFLNEMNVDQLEFLCLTHPHDDHYRGMSQILALFPVKLFWHSGANELFIKELARYIRLECEVEGSEEAKESGNEFSKIYASVSNLRKRKKLLMKCSRPATLLYPVPADFESTLRIVALAPVENHVSSYQGLFGSRFDDKGRFIGPVPRQHHNTISMALLIIFGNTRVILGGDVERPGWQAVLKEYPIDDLAAHLVKVSHHGSENGYCDELWPGFSAKGKPFAVITPYVKFGLPKLSVINMLRSHASRTLITCGTAIKPAEFPPPLQIEKFRSRVALHSKFKELRSDGIHQWGRWSFAFDSQGKCVERTAHAGAVDITE